MGKITIDLSRQRSKGSLPGEIFSSGLVSDWAQARILGLLFDNLVSDLQFFCQPRLYRLAEELRTGRAIACVFGLSTVRHTKTFSKGSLIDRQVSSPRRRGSCRFMHTPIEGFDPGSE